MVENMTIEARSKTINLIHPYIDKVEITQPLMFLRHTRIDENGATLSYIPAWHSAMDHGRISVILRVRNEVTLEVCEEAA
jgi:hypothetical protein